jgi:nicotinamidase-related amidase
MSDGKAPVWHNYLTDRDKKVFEASGYGARQGWGRRPALVIVDATYAFCGDKREPILESIKRWPHSCGEEAWDGIDAIAKLIAACRAKRLPVIYTAGTRRLDNWDAGSWNWKHSRYSEAPRTSATNRDANDIVEEVAPRAEDLVVHKLKPSGFAGTPLTSFLTMLGCDSILLTGTTTSGCVRATAIDAFSLNYRVAVVEEGCFDRSQASHAINLCDMHAKYADVVKLDETVSFVKALPDGLFNLPSGQPT